MLTIAEVSGLIAAAVMIGTYEVSTRGLPMPVPPSFFTCIGR